MAVLLPVPLVYGAQLHFDHEDTLAPSAGECTWHFVHNQIDKSDQGLLSMLNTTFSADGVPPQLNNTPANKKMRHYFVITTSAFQITLITADDDGGVVNEGKLLLSDVSCEPVVAECPCGALDAGVVPIDAAQDPNTRICRVQGDTLTVFDTAVGGRYGCVSDFGVSGWPFNAGPFGIEEANACVTVLKDLGDPCDALTLFQ